MLLYVVVCVDDVACTACPSVRAPSIPFTNKSFHGIKNYLSQKPHLSLQLKILLRRLSLSKVPMVARERERATGKYDTIQTMPIQNDMIWLEV